MKPSERTGYIVLETQQELDDTLEGLTEIGPEHRDLSERLDDDAPFEISIETGRLAKQGLEKLLNRDGLAEDWRPRIQRLVNDYKTNIETVSEVQMREQIQQSVEEFIGEVGLKTARDFMWLLSDPKFLESVRHYRNMDVVEFHNYGQD